MLFDSASPTDIWSYINSGGVVGLLVFIILSGWRGMWVSKREHDQTLARLATSEEQTVKWMELAFTATKVTEQVSDILKVK